MKRKVKKYAGGDMVTSRGGNTNIRTRTDEEFAEDSKFGGYGRYMPKTTSTAKEDRPTSSGVEDYSSMGKRAEATSTWSGAPSVKEETKTDKETISEPDSVAGEGAKNLALEKPEERKTVIKKVKKTSSSAANPTANKQKLGSTYAAMYGRLQDSSIPEGPGKEALKKAVDKARKDYESAPMKKGGSVKMSSGGKTSSASSRGDGIAQRGKTRGRIC